jgi:hypothetical protein
MAAVSGPDRMPWLTQLGLRQLIFEILRQIMFKMTP